MTAPWKDERVRRIYARPEIKASLEIVLSVFTVSFLLLVAIRPTLGIVSTLHKRVGDQSLVERRLTTKIAQLTMVRADLNTYAGSLMGLMAAIPATSDQGGIVKRVEIEAYENGLKINGLSVSAVPLVGKRINLSGEPNIPEEPESKGKVGVYSLSFDVSGSQEQVLKFLTGLERMDRLVFLTNVDLKKESFAAVGTGEIVKGLRAVGDGKLYYFLEKQEK